MKKFSYILFVLCCIFLVSCNLEKKEIILNERLFENSSFINNDINSDLTEIIFEGNQMIVKIDATKTKKSGFPLQFIVGTNNREDASRVVTYTKYVDGFNMKYGDFYHVFYNYKIVNPTNESSDWKIAMQYFDKNIDKEFVDPVYENIFFFNEKNGYLIDQYGNSYYKK